MRSTINILFLSIGVILSGCLAQSSADEDYHPGLRAARLSLSIPSSTLFGNPYVGDCEDATVTVTNAGSVLATDLSASVDSPFSVSGGSCGASLAAGLSCTMTITYCSSGFGEQTAPFTLSYTSDSGSRTRTTTGSLSASGTGGSSGTLDTQTFSGDGIIYSSDAYQDGGYRSGMAVQSDGKIVVAGRTSAPDFGISRFLTNGDVDTSFGSSGAVTVATGTGWDFAQAVAIQSDGKIVVAGTTNSLADFAVIRLLTDGTLDTTFSSDGIQTVNVGSADRIYGIALQSDGKIVAVGDSNVGAGNYNIVVLRFATDGSLDTTFDSDGIVTYDSGANGDEGRGIAIQSDGKIVVVGSTTTHFLVLRYDTNGSLDTTFDSDGVVTTLVDSGGLGSLNHANGVALQSDGKIVAGGWSYTDDTGATYSGQRFKFAAVRYDTDGSLDTSFDSDGIVTEGVFTGFEYGNAIAIQSDGKIVMTGQYDPNGYDDDAVAAILRLNSDGSVDTTFDGDGKMLLSTELGESAGYVVVRQPDGKMLVGGVDWDIPYKIFTLRFWP